MKKFYLRAWTLDIRIGKFSRSISEKEQQQILLKWSKVAEKYLLEHQDILQLALPGCIRIDNHSNRIPEA